MLAVYATLHTVSGLDFRLTVRTVRTVHQKFETPYGRKPVSENHTCTVQYCVSGMGRTNITVLYNIYGKVLYHSECVRQTVYCAVFNVLQYLYSNMLRSNPYTVHRIMYTIQCHLPTRFQKFTCFSASKYQC